MLFIVDVLFHKLSKYSCRLCVERNTAMSYSVLIMCIALRTLVIDSVISAADSAEFINVGWPALLLYSFVSVQDNVMPNPMRTIRSVDESAENDDTVAAKSCHIVHTVVSVNHFYKYHISILIKIYSVFIGAFFLWVNFVRHRIFIIKS
jgi:hypothetical protein